MANSRFNKLLSYLRPHGKKVILGMVALLLVNSLGVYIPLLIRDTIDQLQELSNFNQLWFYVLPMIALASLMLVMRMLSRILIFGVGRQVEVDLKQKIFQHLLRLEPAYFAIHNSGDLINRATSDVDNLRRLVGFAVLSLANTIFAYGLTLPVMLGIDVKLSLWAVSVYPIMLMIVQLFSDKLREYQRLVQENLSDLSRLIQEDMSGISLIKIYAQEENEHRAFRSKNKRLLSANLKLARTRYLLFPLIEGISLISLLILLWFGATAIENNTITVGDLVALIIFVERLVFPTALLGFTITAYQRGEVSIERLEEIFGVQPQISDAQETISVDIGRIQGKLEAKNFSYTYSEAQVRALNNLNFTIEPGETVAIVGSIGSGKSTLANAIPRLLDVEAGQLFLDGKDITKLRLEDLRGAIAYVPQDSFLFSTTIKNNLGYECPLSEDSKITYAAKQAQIHEEILNFPQQYETIVGERGITLSGGQRQRTSLGRALMVDAPVLILDDALSSVDNQTATQILANLAEGVQRKTVIFISHQLSAAATADRIFVMDAGKIVQVGTHEELLANRGLYQHLWQQHQLEEVLH